MSNGYLITIEGIDGSGKSTVMDSITASDLDTGERDVVFSREPTDSDAGQLLRENLATDTSDVWTELFLFMADHATHLTETIAPAIENGDVVLCDRYIDSRCAYQGYTLDGVVPNPLRFVWELHTPWSRSPDYTIYLDIDAETAVNRTTTGEKYETEERLNAVRENYEKIQRVYDDRFIRIDATQPPDAVRDDMIEVIESITSPDGSRE